MIKNYQMNVSNQTLEIHHENDIFMNIFIIISILIPITLCFIYILYGIFTLCRCK